MPDQSLFHGSSPGGTVWKILVLSTETRVHPDSCPLQIGFLAGQPLTGIAMIRSPAVLVSCIALGRTMVGMAKSDHYFWTSVLKYPLPRPPR
jgi:hypothetical protein